MASLIPDDCFWFVYEDALRVAKIKRKIGYAVIVTLYRNDDDAWEDKPIWDSLLLEGDLIAPEDYQDYPFWTYQEYPEDTRDPV